MNSVFDWVLSHPLIVIIIVLVLYIIFTYNNLNGKKHRIEKSFSNIDVYLQARFDKIKALLEQTSKAYDHESDVFKGISRLRTGITKAMEEGSSINDKVSAENEINAFVRSPLIRTEAYPELSAIKELGMYTAKQTVISEEDLAAARKQYNSNVTSFNRTITTFPTLLVAKLLGFGTAYELFKVAEEAKERPTFNSVKEEQVASEIKIDEMKQAADAAKKIQDVANEAALKVAKIKAEETVKGAENTSKEKNTEEVTSETKQTE